MLIEAIAISLVLGFLLFEATGLVAGGLIAPAYFALSFNQPWAIALSLGASICTLLLVRGLSSFLILFGRRRFIVCVLVAFALQWTVGSYLVGSAMGPGRLEVLGYIVPGLVANEMDRQGVAQSLAALLVLSCLTFILLQGLIWLRS